MIIRNLNCVPTNQEQDDEAKLVKLAERLSNHMKATMDSHNIIMITTTGFKVLNTKLTCEKEVIVRP